MRPRPPRAHNHVSQAHVCEVGYPRHGPISVVSAPQRSECYAFVALPTISSHGEGNEAHQTCAEAP
jgi:hypothetical protein